MILEGNAGKYQVGELVAETDPYRVYICEDIATDRQLLLQVATAIEHNGGLQKAVYILKELRQTADEFETANTKNGGERPLSYERLFPEVVDSFIVADQGNRRVNVLAIAEVEDVRLMVPLSNLASKDHQRVALISSAWIMGRLLKLLGLTHNEGIAVRALRGGNVLIEPSGHFVVVFDWSSARIYKDKEDMPKEARKDDVAGAAKTVFAAIGGNPETGEFKYPDDTDPRYVKFLWHLACRHEGDAIRAHDKFYELVDELWGRKFNPFQTLPL